MKVFSGSSAGGIALKKGATIPIIGNSAGRYSITFDLTPSDTYVDIASFVGSFAFASVDILSIESTKQYQFRILDLNDNLLHQFEPFQGQSSFRLLQGASLNTGFIVLQNCKFQAQCIGNTSTNDNFNVYAWEI